MIDDHVVHSGFGRSVEQNVVAGVVLHVAAHPHAQVANDDIVGAVDEPHAPVAVRLPRPFDLHPARRCLPGHGKIGRAHLDRTFQRDRAAHPEHADPRPGCFQATAQTSRPRIVEIGHLDNSSATAADRIGAKPFRRREGFHGLSHRHGRDKEWQTKSWDKASSREDETGHSVRGCDTRSGPPTVPG